MMMINIQLKLFKKVLHLIILAVSLLHLDEIEESLKWCQVGLEKYEQGLGIVNALGIFSFNFKS